jgi:tungstate transport system substrate-binding protein
VKKELGRKFVDWVLSAKGRETIKSYQIEGKQLFFPNAKAGS